MLKYKNIIIRIINSFYALIKFKEHIFTYRIDIMHNLTNEFDN